jgi:hypothetical protein
MVSTRLLLSDIDTKWLIALLIRTPPVENIHFLVAPPLEFSYILSEF